MQTTSASRRRHLHLALFVLSSLLCCPLARAQPIGRTVVVPMGSPDAHDAFWVADTLEAKLAERRVAVVPLHDARDRFTAHSRPPLSASSSDLDVLAREARQAIEHVAFGRTSAAQRSVREVMARAEKTLESLNRETVRARQLLDACLALVRSQLHAGKREEALEQATACRRLVPDLAPSEAAHPPQVIGVLAEADDLMRRMRIGKLTVLSAPEHSCSVFLNGRHLGTTPFILDRAAAGEYRVQVECNTGARGRVHVVQLGDGPVDLTVDTLFDQTVSSEPRLSLAYRDPELLMKRAQLDAALLGQAVRAEDTILVRMLGDRAELLRVQVQLGRVIGRATVLHDAPEPERSASWTVALATLLEGRIEGTPSLATAEHAEPSPRVTTAPPVRSPEPPPARKAPVHTTQQRQRLHERTGYALAGVAGALFTTGLVLDLRSHAVNREIVSQGELDTLDEDNQRYDRLSAASWLGVATGPVGIAAALLTVRPHRQLPWWSYTLGGAGVGLAAYSIYEFASADHCELRASDRTCLVEKDSGRRGAILLSSAISLISVPLFHLWKRGPRQRDIAIQAQPTSGGAYLSASVQH